MRRIRLLLLVLVLGAVCAFVLPARDGRPLFSFSGAKAKASRLASGFRESRSGGGGARADEGMRTVYKWKDRHGVWHYGNRRPADHPEAREVRLPISWVRGDGGSKPSSSPEVGHARQAGPKEKADPELEALMDEANR